VDAEDDWLLRFLFEFASMSEEERDAAIDALPAEGRQALLSLSQAKAATAATNLIEALDEGHGGLERLYEVADPTELLTVINLAAISQPSLLVEALFAAVIVHRGWARGEPPAIESLRDEWIWHVHEQVSAARAREDERRT